MCKKNRANGGVVNTCKSETKQANCSANFSKKTTISTSTTISSSTSTPTSTPTPKTKTTTTPSTKSMCVEAGEHTQRRINFFDFLELCFSSFHLS